MLLFERYDSQKEKPFKEKPFKHLTELLNRDMRQTKKELFEIIQQQIEVIEYWMEKALDKSDAKV